MRWKHCTEVLTISVLNRVLERGRCRTAWNCCLAVQQTDPGMPLKLWFRWGSKQEPSFFLLLKLPVEYCRQGQCLGFRRIHRMMEQLIESSVTKPGPALGAPGKIPHNHLRQLLSRDFSLFLNSCVCFLMPAKYRQLKTLFLMLKEGRKAMTPDLHVLGPAFFLLSAPRLLKN